MTRPLLEIAKAVVQTEADSILMLKDRIDQTFNDACQLMLSCEGKVILIGMGKSGHIAKKIATTLAQPAHLLFTFTRVKQVMEI